MKIADGASSLTVMPSVDGMLEAVWLQATVRRGAGGHAVLDGDPRPGRRDASESSEGGAGRDERRRPRHHRTARTAPFSTMMKRSPVVGSTATPLGNSLAFAQALDITDKPTQSAALTC
jgi:hypothetical protein